VGRAQVHARVSLLDDGFATTLIALHFRRMNDSRTL
jgi:hypothetical protein